VLKPTSEVIALVELAVTDSGRLEVLRTWQLKSGPFTSRKTVTLVGLFPPSLAGQLA
jgi:hypothetical protein